MAKRGRRRMVPQREPVPREDGFDGRTRTAIPMCPQLWRMSATTDDAGGLTCQYCGDPSGGERVYVRHLSRAHQATELIRIDRHRVEATFDGLTVVWADVMAEQLASTPRRTARNYVRSPDRPVPATTLRSLGLLAAGLVLLITGVLAMIGPRVERALSREW